MKRSHLSGLTLVEVLVVLVIIAVLASVTFVLARQARAAAMTSGCLSNLSSLGKGMLLYAADNDDYIPPYSTNNEMREEEGSHDLASIPGRPDLWKKSLLAYVKDESQFYCPTDSFARRDTEIHITGGVRTNKATSYETLIAAGWQVSRAGTILLHLTADTKRFPYLRDVVVRKLDRNASYPFATSHGLRINELHYDGSAHNTSLN